ncbi:glycosyltransferase family 4 protein [Luteococcus sp. Sow4_B9]|uniref:glycosyltransferase family 4 protein n=1 Tax=Luteococcus sp. Sow4_B9 TaxID=3438792 RepID=UPI003F986594
MTKVAHLSTVHRPRDPRIFNKEASALAAEGLDVTLIARGTGSDPVNGVTMEELPQTQGRLQRMVQGQLNAWRALGRVRPDVVHAHDPELIPMAMLWARTHGAGFIFDAHEDLVGQIEDKAYLKGPVKAAARLYARLILGLADRFADGIVVATPVIREKYRNPHTTVVRNFPWLKDFPQVEREPVSGRVVYVGGLTRSRESGVMLETVKAVEGASMLLAGPADAHTQALLDALRPDDGIDYRGTVAASEVPALLATGAVGFVFLQPLPNYRESLPTKLFEYMAAGIPFIASDFPYWRGLFEKYDAGVFVDTTTPEAPIRALRELIGDPQRCREMGERGRRAIEEHFNFEADVPALVEVTERAAAAR